LVLEWIAALLIQDISITVADSCLVKGFKLLVANSNDLGMGMAGNGSKNSLITLNKITGANFGIFLDATFYPISDVTVNKNICENVRTGIELFNSNSTIKNNFIYTDINYSSGRGINIGAFTNSYVPTIESNYIETNSNGISISIGTKPTIKNNIIFLNDDFAYGIWGGSPDTIWVYNNLILSENATQGLANSIVPTYSYNNFLIGNFNYCGIFAESLNYIFNNMVINSPIGIRKPSNSTPVYKYNNSWNNTINYSGFTPDSTNLSVDPMIVNDDTTRGDLDFHLQKYSPLIDAGDPNILDKDGSRSDIGLFGGSFGESYKYLDLAPSPPLNLTAVSDSIEIFLSWNKNSETDTSFYKVYRDTVINFQIDSTKLISSSADTFFVQINPHNVTKYVYKVTCVDKQGNESEPSEEKVVIITGIENYPQLITDYQLYQNYPNPFNPSTKISYRLKERGYVKLYVYDIKGELVSVLVNKEQNAGFYQVEFNTTDKQQSTTNSFASGIYIYQILVTGENNIPVFSDIKKMLMIK
jgi:parallel beta-helix repeat protein